MPIIALPINITNKNEIKRFYRKTNLSNNESGTSIGNILLILFFCLKLSYELNDNVYSNIIEKWCSKDMENINKNETIFRNINTKYMDFNTKFHNLDINKIVEINFDFNKYPNIKNIIKDGIAVRDTNIPWFIPIKYLEKIQKFFEPDENNLKYIYSKYKKYLDKNTCSIHFRTFNKDFNTDYNRNQVISKSKTMINVIQQNLKITDYFLVFSDDFNFIKKFISDNFKEDKFIFINERDYIDLWIMSLCKNNIGFYESTFFRCSTILNKNKNKKIHALKMLKLNKNSNNYNPIEDYNIQNVSKIYNWNFYNWEFNN